MRHATCRSGVQVQTPVDHRKGDIRRNHIDRVRTRYEAMGRFGHRQRSLSAQNLREQALTAAIKVLYDYHGRIQPGRQGVEELRKRLQSARRHANAN